MRGGIVKKSLKLLQAREAIMMEHNGVSTGIPGLDAVLDYLRWGDNVVWQVESIQDYQHFVIPLVNQALSEKRKIVYIRFAHHSPVVDESIVKTYRLNPQAGFEAFLSRVYEIATQEGAHTILVFDSLSDLLYAWATDLMIGNFFRIICPYLYRLRATAYFAIIRDRNSHHTMMRIRNTTQLLLNVYRQEDQYYVHPLKVSERYSPTLFLPHLMVNNDMIPITNSYEIANLFARFQYSGDAGRKLDYWDRVILKAQELQDRIYSGEAVAADKIDETVAMLCQMMIGRETRIADLAHQYFSLRDLLYIRSRLIGTGMIGGKAVGMLLARNILRHSSDRDWNLVLEPHDSFFVGSDVYYTYLIENDCWNLILEQRKPENYLSLAAELRQRILDGVLPETIREHFTEVMDYFGQSPIIVRSSSLLEDDFGHAFAGKYESLFCVNQGNPQERCRHLEHAIKSVYASTMNKDALTYRRQKGMDQCHEQMPLLIQRVSGSYQGRYFFPAMAGVALSHNLYVWRKGMDQNAGMMRLVAGLGTRAVARSGSDYTRMVALDQPLLRPESAWNDVRSFSQHQIDLLDTVENQLVTVTTNTLGALHPEPEFWRLVAEEDHELEYNRPGPKRWVLTFSRVLGNTSFPQTIREMLNTLERAYNHPVDIEFTVNLSHDTLKINLLQCRPLSTWDEHQSHLQTPPIIPGNVVFASQGNCMGGNTSHLIQRVIMIDSEAYAQLHEADKHLVARWVGRLNRDCQSHSLTAMLMGPGRWGSSIPSLGVPVSFAEICNFTVLVEIAGQGYLPEVSFGTHFFQDLVENRISYVALYPGQDGAFFDPKMLVLWNQSDKILLEEPKLKKVIKIMDFASAKISLWFTVDASSGKVVCYYTPGEKPESCPAVNISSDETLIH